MGENKDQQQARQGRVVAVVIAIGGLLAILAPWLVQVFGLAPRFEMLFYLASMAAFVWALVVAIGIWRKRQDT
ncbi:DUF5337 domain-containing protein [Mesobacterium pallidum]|uniref:DUF5337 domain-containing protein n=1 Tax=Mesobacterium pallidum TaxID=2872037 RepID=UPI001EE1D12D|nr:DUF5337 domain-containing protein [Mesobacterium pallidum]